MFVKTVLEQDHPYRDFRNFLYTTWKFLGLPDPTPMQYDMAHWLQTGPKRSISEAYRGFGKSYITSAFACWCWLNDPDFKVMVISGSKDRADDFSRFCLMLLRTMPELSHLTPRPEQLQSLMKFEVNGCKASHSPSCKSVGITGQLTGSRADLIIADDVETPKNSRTITEREKLESLVTEFDAILKPDDHCRVVYLGTPQNEDSLYNKLEPKGYDVRVWPARMPRRSSREDKYGGRLSPMIYDLDVQDWDPLDPQRFDEDDLLDRERSYGATGFALQFQLDTTLDDDLKFPLKCRDMIVMDLDREIAPVKVTWASGKEQQLEDIPCAGLKGDRFHKPMYVSEDHTEYTGKVMVIDPSGRGADRTGYCVINHLKGMLYMRRAGSLEGGYQDDSLETLAHIARAEGVTLVLVESNFGDGMFTQLLKPVLQRIYPVTVEEYSVHTQKEVRVIDTMEPVLNQHRLVIDKQILVNDLQSPQEHSFVYQMTRMTKQRGALGHDDVIDAVAAGIRYWVDRMELDVSGDVEKDHRRERLDEELDAWLDEIHGRSSGNIAWNQSMR